MRQQGNSDTVCPGCCCHVLSGVGRISAVCHLQMEVVFCGGVCLSGLLGRSVHAVLSMLYRDYIVSEEDDEEKPEERLNRKRLEEMPPILFEQSGLLHYAAAPFLSLLHCQRFAEARKKMPRKLCKKS